MIWSVGLFAVNCIVLHSFEPWSWLETMYYTMNVMITVGFVDDLKVKSMPSKIFLATFIPITTVVFFHYLGEYMEKANKAKKRAAAEHFTTKSLTTTRGPHRDG